MNYRCMEMTDYESIIKLWQESEGLKLRDIDSKEGISVYLLRNPKLSFVTEHEEEIIGTIMSGHDGKRGYIQHLAVSPKFRSSGIATNMLKLCITALKSSGIIKSHIHILNDNGSAKEFWSNRGWIKRTDIEVYSYINSNNKNA